jgi:DNA-binding response OmpR family regulator
MAKNILLVDDEPNILVMLSSRLKKNGYDVITARDGQEAFDVARKSKPDLIILDLMLPRMDGYTVCGLLKKDTKYSMIPIIMLTAKAQESDIKMGETVGADAYVKKPFTSEELMEVIKSFLKE